MTQPSSELLTDAERELVSELGNVYRDFCGVVGDGRTRDADLHEVVIHIHALQALVMAQAAARAYPYELRLLGETLDA